MKNEIIIKPLTGIEWVQGNINLEEQRQSLNLPQVQAEKIRQSLYLGNGDIRVDFDEKDAVEFIEIRGGCDSSFCPIFQKIPLFELEAAEVVRLLKENYAVEERENGHSYVIPELELVLWRERTEADVEGFIADMKADGVTVEGNADVEIERKMAMYFETVAIGKKGYYTK